MRLSITLCLSAFFVLTSMAQVSLPITFEDTAMINYDLADFGGNASMIIADPEDANNLVVQSIKTDVAELWAGTVAGGAGLTAPVPFTTDDTKMSVRVWSPDAGIPVRLKVENNFDPTVSVETEATTSSAGAWETLEFDFSNEAPGTAALNLDNVYDKVAIFFNFGTTGAEAGEKTYYWDDVSFVEGGGNGGEKSQVDLPITFEDTAGVDYALVDFGGNASMIITDPEDASNTVVQSTKTDVAELWAGTTAGGEGLASAVPFTMEDTKMSVRVWSPDAGIPVRLKVEDATDPTISVETEAMTTTAAAWETLEFDFNNEAPGTAALNIANTYDKASIFFNFGTTGADAGEKTYYWDDVQFVEGGGNGGEKAQVDLPITFEDTAGVDYALVDFGGNASMIITDPEDASNTVVQSIKTETAELWAGTTAGGEGLASPVPFTMDDTKMSVRVWSPDAGIPVRLKVEDATDPTISVETEAMTTAAAAWETLEFDFSNEVEGTAALNIANTYDKASIFFNFGTTGADAGEKTYFWDDVQFVEGDTGAKDLPALPITFEDTAGVDYNLADFGGNASMIIADPEDATNLVVQSVKTDVAELWAGTVAGGAGLASPVPFTMDDTKMSVRVWSPDADIPVRLKVENNVDPTISVETEARTTTAGAWEVLEFNFADEAPGTAALNLDNVYDKVAIFFNFGTTGADAGEKTYYWDDVQFVEGGGTGNKEMPALPITFEDTATVDYNLADFGGNASMIIVDPEDETNLVVQSIKTDGAELWAGTVAGGAGLASAIPFTMEDTKMTVRVWSPDADIPVRLKVENAVDPTISVETEARTTTAGEWETLVFDFSMEVDGTAPLNIANTYDKVAIFFNFGTTGADAGEKTYYWDDVLFGDGTISTDNLVSSDQWTLAPNPNDGRFTLLSKDETAEIIRLDLFDSAAKPVASLERSQITGDVQFDGLDAGQYILRIQSTTGVTIKKVTVLR